MISKIRTAAQAAHLPAWSIPIALLFLTAIGYGLRIFVLGFYWDDFPYLWFFQRLGPQGIIQAFNQDRPFLSALYITSLYILGHSIPGWQIFALLARWLTSVGVWWMLSLTWPRHSQKAAWAAALFAVYPGFTQQWIAVIYGQAFILFAALFFSIGLMLWLARKRNSLSRGWIIGGTLLALALSAFNIYSTEYFFGLELLRPALLGYLFMEQPWPEAAARRREFWRRLRQTAAWWAPYLALIVSFVIWRGFFHALGSYRLSVLQSAEQSPIPTLWGLAQTIFTDLIEATVIAWGQPLQLSGVAETGGAAAYRLLAVVLVTVLLALAYLAWLRPCAPEVLGDEPREAQGTRNRIGQFLQTWSGQAVLLGLFAMLIAGWPFWITRLPLRMGWPQDRFTLPLALGACLILAGLVDRLGKNLFNKALILAFAIALAAGFHDTTASLYHDDWNLARDFFWQLAWRAPTVAPNTLFLSDSLPFRYYEDDSLTAPLNWTYDPNGRTPGIKYLFFDILTRYHQGPVYLPDQTITKVFRAVEFNGSPSRVLLVAYSPPGCARILDPEYDAELYQLPQRVQKSLYLSNPRQLISDQGPAAAPPADIFGSEPKHHWCYFFEKADLARQEGDWQTILYLRRQSIAVGYRPEDPAEYLPFIEADARLGQWDRALKDTLSTYNAAPVLRPALCAAWQRSVANPGDPAGAKRAYAQLDEQIHCPSREMGSPSP